ncbi:MAG TPA: hypothetical protein VMW12_04445 [Candidatus Dormibacteraeota bacterium]|nr:hypothetical protein [Candidatus Dormibacteraeota bacterium]
MQAKLNASESALKHLYDNKNLYRATEIFGQSFRTNHANSEHSRVDNSFGYLFLGPTARISSEFNIIREVLFYADESTAFTSKSFQNITRLLDDNKLRLMQDVVFVASQDVRAEKLCAEHIEETGRKLIYCSFADLQSAGEDFAAELLRRFLYSRDLFDVSDPVSTDEQFFARYKLVDEIYDALVSGQSSGIFGLRKIGKTSVLERLRKKNDLTGKFHIAYLDAQSPEVYRNDPAGVAYEIARAFNRSYAQRHGQPFQKDVPSGGNLLDASRFLRDFLTRLIAQSNKPLLVIIDELERILPTSSSTNAWNTQYIDLWRLMRSESQIRAGKFVFLVASTNPYFAEVANVAGEDNPLYRFIKARYLTPFGVDDLAEMIGKLGQPMGVSFQREAVESIHEWFGGHPFLSRQLCSAIARDLPERPLIANARNVDISIESNGSQFRGDLDAILKLFSDFYPEEREILQELAEDERKALKMLEDRPLAGQHLIGYGLIRKTKNSYKFNMAALPPYLITVPPPEFKQDDIPEAGRERHLRLQSRMNSIEPALRMLVFGRLQGEFGGNWFSAVQMKNVDRERIEQKGDLNNLELIEETFLTDLLSTILHHWKLFSKVFISRTEFLQNQKRLAESARPISDHRKIQMCADDAQYLAASDACLWFEQKVL